MSYGVRSGVSASFFDQAGSFSFSAIAAPQNVAAVEKAFVEELNRALADGFTPEEVDNAKTGLLRAREVARTNDDNITYLLVSLMHQGIWMKQRIDFERRLAALTPAEVNAAFRRYIEVDKLSFVNAGDFRKLAAK